MSGYVVSPKADEDIFENWQYLYERAGVEVANRVEAEIYRAFATLAQNQRLGHKRSDLTSHPVLFFTIYFIYDRVSSCYAPRYRSSPPWQEKSEANPGRTLKRAAAPPRFEDFPRYHGH